jgi:hypothetical protein
MPSFHQNRPPQDKKHPGLRRHLFYKRRDWPDATYEYLGETDTEDFDAAGNVVWHVG